MADLKLVFAYVQHFEDAKGNGKVTTDEGGKTRFGVAQKFHPDLDESFYEEDADAAREKAEEILVSEYFAPLSLCQLESQALANKIGDIAVNCGVTEAVHLVQKSLNYLGANPRLVEDNQFGPHTLAALLEVEPELMINTLRQFLKMYYDGIAQHRTVSVEEYHSWMTRGLANGRLVA